MKKPIVSLNVCKSTMRGPARTDPEQWWYIRFLRRFFKLRFDDKPDFLFYGDLETGDELLYPSDVIRIFTTGENIQPNWDVADYALTHERIYDDRHWRLPLHRHWYDTTCTTPQRDYNIISSRVSRFCNFIYSNKDAKERVDFFHLLSQYKHVDSGGLVCNNMGGRVDNKQELVSQCKFTIAFENSSRSGYSTEKIIEPLLCGSIPIYWGDPDIALDFNPECMINVHSFENFDAVIEHVIHVDQDSKLWEKYVTVPIFTEDKLPELLSDEALTMFFKRIFIEKRSRISKSKKTIQKVKEKIKRVHIVKSVDANPI